jgi:outer membrane immunogenic protein
MRKLFFSLLAATALTGAAHAGDLPSLKAPPAPPAIEPSWTGFYGGIQGGGAFGNTDFTQPNIGYRAKWQNDGVIGGVHFGFNYQVQQVVVGLQAQGDLLSVATTHSDSVHFSPNIFSASSHNDWIASIDGRLGYLVRGNILVYAIGGYAFADAQSSINNNAAQIGNISTSLNGYDVGGGVEYAINRSWSANLEYRFYDFDKFNALYTNTTTAFNEKTQFSTVRAGLSYHWGKEEAVPTVVAKF